MTSTADHRHRRARHQRPDADDLLGTIERRRAGRRGRPGRLGRTGAPRPRRPTSCVDVGGRAVLPGFVDSHSHLVFAGDRSAEFAARMTGTPYAAGGIRTTVAATRAATDEQLTSHVARLVAEMRRQGTTTVEIKSGYGLTVARRGPRAGGRPAVHRRDDVPRRARRAASTDDPAAYVDLVTGPMLDAASSTPAGSTSSASAAPSTATRRAPILAAGAAAGSPGPAPRQPAHLRPRRPAGRRARPGRGRPLHLPRRRGRRRAARQRHHRDPAPGRRVLDPAALPRRAAD